MLILVAALAALLQVQDPPRRVFGPPTAQSFVTARDALDEALFDYPSARFRDVTANELKICGKVNAKNRMGAYTGWTNFVVWLGDEPAAYVGDEEILVDAFCGGDKKPASPDYSDRVQHR